MKKKEKLGKLLSVVFVGILCAISVYAAADFASVGAKSALDLFNCDGVVMHTDERIPYETEIDDDRKGVLFTADTAGASFSFAQALGGLFELDFRVFSEVTANESSLSSVPNSAFDLSELTFTFTDTENGSSFDVIISGGSPAYGILPTAKVRLKNLTTGYWYNRGAAQPTKTYQKTYHGYYTVFFGTSFCNQTYTAGTFVTGGVQPSVLGFDPDTMELYGYNYNENTGVKEKRLICDMDDPSIIGENNCLSGFHTYTVKCMMSAVNAGRTGKVLLYALTGQSLAGRQFTDTTGGNVSFSAEQCYGVAGHAMPIVRPSSVNDVICGTTEFNGTVTVTAPSGATVAVPAYRFTPEESGQHIVTYETTDFNGQKASRSRTFTVYAEYPAYPFEYAYKIADGDTLTVERGSTVTLPAATVFDPLTGKSAATDVTVAGAGGTVPIESETFTATEERYTVEYAYTDGIGGEHTETLTVYTVDVPVLHVPWRWDTVRLGSRVDLPKAADGTVACRTVFPDGRTVAGHTVYADAVGEYRVVYTYEKDDVRFETMRFFSAFESGDGLFVGEDVTFTADASAPDNYDFAYNGTGITVVKDGGTATYAHTLDLSKNTKEDVLLDFLVTPETDGSQELNALFITLTDVHDAANTVSICVKADVWGNQARALTSVKSSSMMEYIGQKELGRYTWTVNGGSYTFFSFRGKFADTNLMQSCKIYYDNTERAIYVGSTMYAYETEADKHLICDLDDSSIVGAGYEWGGFTTGEVILSIRAEGLSAGSANYIVREVNGQNLGGKFLRSERTPTMLFDFSGNAENNLPYGVVGTPYKLFDVVAYDVVDGRLAVEKTIYYRNDAGTLTRYYNPELTADTLLPDKAGDYVIRYAASNSDGKRAVYDFTVEVRERADAVDLEFEKELPDRLRTGERFELGSYRTVGTSGVADVRCRISLDGQDIPDENGLYHFTAAGTYLVTFDITDYISSYQKVYTIEVEDDSAPLYAPISMPQAVVSGLPFDLPIPEAVFYDDGNAYPAKTHIFIRQGETGAETELTGTRYDTGSFVGTLYIRYEIYADERPAQKAEETFTVQAIAPAQLSDYWIKDGVSCTVGDSYLLFAAERDNGNVSFVNEVRLDVYSLRFAVDPAQNEFSAVNVTLTDSVDLTQSMVLTFRKKDADSSELYVNGVYATDTKATFFGSVAPFYVEVRGNELYDYDGTYLTTIGTYRNGNTFRGFSSDKVRTNIALAGKTGESAIRLEQLGNQTFYDMAEDDVRPIVIFGGEFNYIAQKGDRVHLPAAYATDILTKDCDLYLSIRLNGQEIYNEKYTDAYSFDLAEAGEYVLSFTAEDANGNAARTPQQTIIAVADDVVKIELGSHDSDGKVGDAVKVADAAVNTPDEYELYVFVVEPTGKMTRITGNTFTPAMAGEHIVRYVVETATGYIASCSYTVEVKA